MPTFVPQVEVLTRGGLLLGRVDALWDRCVVGEADGVTKYLDDLDGRGSTPSALKARLLEADRRASRIRDHGLEVVRWEPNELRTPARIARRYHDARARTDPSRVTADLRCHCCHLDLTDCAVSRRLAEFRARIAA